MIIFIEFIYSPQAAVITQTILYSQLTPKAIRNVLPVKTNCKT